MRTKVFPEIPRKGPPPAKREGIINTSTREKMSPFSTQVIPTTATAMRTTPREKTICLTPKPGMRTKTVKKVPKMLPAVEMEPRLPEMPPRVEMLSADILTEYGETIPRRVVGAARSRREARMGPYLSPAPER